MKTTEWIAEVMTPAISRCHAQAISPPVLVLMAISCAGVICAQNDERHAIFSINTHVLNLERGRPDYMGNGEGSGLTLKTYCAISDAGDIPSQSFAGDLLENIYNLIDWPNDSGARECCADDAEGVR